MKNKNSKKNQKKSVQVQLLGKSKASSTLAADEYLFNFIEKNYPEIKENSYYEINYYIIAKAEADAKKCADLLKQGLSNITNYQVRITLFEVGSSRKFGIGINFMTFPFNLDEIKKWSKYFDGVANKAGCAYDRWEVGFMSNKKS